LLPMGSTRKGLSCLPPGFSHVSERSLLSRPPWRSPQSPVDRL
jgi:hypothetical protein